MSGLRASLHVACSVALALWAAPALGRESFWCGGDLVRVGDAGADAVARCGEPTSRDARRVQRVYRLVDAGGSSYEQHETAVVETWTYDFGPERFIEILTVEGGLITAISHGGYGYAGR